MNGALVGTCLASLAALPTVGVFVSVFCALGFAFAAELRAQFAEARVPFGTPQHRRGGGAANLTAIQAGQRALDHLGRRVADVFRRALITGHCAEHARLNRALHISFGFFAHIQFGLLCRIQRSRRQAARDQRRERMDRSVLAARGLALTEHVDAFLLFALGIIGEAFG